VADSLIRPIAVNVNTGALTYSGSLTTSEITDGTLTTSDIDTTSFDARYVVKSNNLSDVTAATARSNLGIAAAFRPASYGYITWAYDPAVTGSATALTTAGTVYTILLNIEVATTITNIIMDVGTAGSSLTTGQCFAALYQGGTLLSTTADQAVAWASTGAKTMALSVAQSVTAGQVIVAVWFNGTTGPSFARGTNVVGAPNVALSGNSSRYGTADTGRTTTAPSTLGAITATNIAYWAALT
jgi:hypothetical protein